MADKKTRKKVAKYEVVCVRCGKSGWPKFMTQAQWNRHLEKTHGLPKVDVSANMRLEL